jgi:class 3 adenylate cyclase
VLWVAVVPPNYDRADSPMGLKEDLTTEVAEIFKDVWTQRDGTVVPSDDSIKLSNDAVNLDATVLYADMADSTALVDSQPQQFSAEIYKTYLRCAAKIITSEGGTITAYDGDRIMAIYTGGSKNTSAVRTGLKINRAKNHIIIPALRNQYPNQTYTPNHVVGIDTGKLFVARAGIRGANDLVWVGPAANYAAKLTALSHEYPTYITSAIYSAMHAEVKVTNGVNMWKSFTWNNKTIYGSTWYWGLV